MALQPVKGPSPVYQQTAKKYLKRTFLQRIKQVLPEGMPEALLHANNAIDLSLNHCPKHLNILKPELFLEMLMVIV